jgi:hypothetical protein
MKKHKTERGFRYITDFNYPDRKEDIILQESSAIGKYKDSFDIPGSSFLWVGRNFHLNREEVKEGDYILFYINQY